MSQPPREGAPPGSGLGAASLHRAIHDLRGPLNTVAILAEIMRHKGAGAEAGDIAKTIAGLGTMLDQLREVAATLTVQRHELDLTAALRAACARFACPAGVTLHPPPEQPLSMLGEHQRLDALLDTTLACATAALPDGGTIAFDTITDGVALRANGPRVVAPPARWIGNLPTAPDDPLADWFRLCCQVEGLGAELRVDHDATTLRIEFHFPTP